MNRLLSTKLFTQQVIQRQGEIFASKNNMYENYSSYKTSNKTQKCGYINLVTVDLLTTGDL